MLKLTRKTGESIIISNGEITVKLLEINGQSARIGIDAPQHVTVDREEIYLRKKRELEARIEGHEPEGNQ